MALGGGMKRAAVSALVVADDELSRVGLLGILSRAHYRPNASAEGWRSIVAFDKPPPRAVILILSGPVESRAVASKVKLLAEQSKIIVLTDVFDATLVNTLIAAGASALLPRSIPADILVRTIDLVLSGNTIVVASAARSLLMCEHSRSQQSTTKAPTPLSAESPSRGLSPREIEILKFLGNGDSNKQISHRLHISETTVKVHVKAILRKIHVRNRTQAAIWAIDHSVVVVRSASVRRIPNRRLSL
jgi:two-component system nitrate/nitrite response regulator NarL